jgi:hypothetical protein
MTKFISETTIRKAKNAIKDAIHKVDLTDMDAITDLRETLMDFDFDDIENPMKNPKLRAKGVSFKQKYLETVDKLTNSLEKIGGHLGKGVSSAAKGLAGALADGMDDDESGTERTALVDSEAGHTNPREIAVNSQSDYDPSFDWKTFLIFVIVLVLFCCGAFGFFLYFDRLAARRSEIEELQQR